MIVLHLDMNSYFASVEQQANPFLRGKAVGVCAYLHPGGCIIAASIEAKARGMKVGMRIEDAKKMIPDAVFVQNDPAKYRTVTSRVFAILHEYSDAIEHYSIDEAFLDLTGWVRDFAEAAWIGARIRQRIYDEVGEWLRCSIGIAHTRFLAKLGSDLEKPSGMTIISQENLESVLSRMDLEDVYGIGRRMARRFRALGHYSPLEIKRAPVANLMASFGIQGYLLWARLNGIQTDSLTSPDTLPKSIGHSYCVPRSVNRRGVVIPVFVKLVQKASKRLRLLGLYAGGFIVTVGLRGRTYSSSGWGIGGESSHIRFDRPVCDSRTIIERALHELHRLRDDDQSVSFLAITLVDLHLPDGQSSLPLDTAFDNSLLKYQSLSFVTDAINDRHGEHAIVPGSLFGITSEDAPDRIGFRKTEGVDV